MTLRRSSLQILHIPISPMLLVHYSYFFFVVTFVSNPNRIGADWQWRLSLLNVNPTKLLVFVAVINAVTAAPLLIVVLVNSNDRQLMGEYVNWHWANILGWLTFAIMGVATIALFATGGVAF